MIVAVVTLLALAPVVFYLWIFGGFAVYGALKQQKGDGGAAEFHSAYTAAQAAWQAAHNRWQHEASDRKFQDKLRQLEHLRDQWHNIPNVRQRRYRELEQERQRKQLQRFLEKFFIEHATIAGVGPGRKAMLESYNVVTAWDVTERNIMRVPGFGPAMTSKLLAWRRNVERRFNFDPSQSIDSRDIVALEREVAESRCKLEQALIAGATELAQIKNQIVARRIALKREVDEAYGALLIAEANRNAANS